MLDVSRRSGAPLHVSHLKSLGDEALIEPLLERLDAADGVSFDQYPYGAGLHAAREPAARVGAGGRRGRDARAACATRRRSARIAHDVEHGLPGWENMLGTLGPEAIVVEGESLAARGGEPVETVAELLLESELGVQMILHYASDEAVRTIAAHPRMLLGSDGIFGEHPHPRVAGSAARFLGRLCLREGLLAPQEAVARLTARAADRFGLADRGRIEVGQARRPRPARSSRLRGHGHLRGAAAARRGRRGRVGRGRARVGRRRADRRARGRRRPVRRDEMPSIAAERALAGRTDLLPLKGSVAAPLPPHVREAVAAALDEHAVTPPSRGNLALREAIARSLPAPADPSASCWSRTAACTRSALAFRALLGARRRGARADAVATSSAASSSGRAASSCRCRAPIPTRSSARSRRGRRSSC